jgi:HK97 family phage major capsid protein
MFIFNNAPPTDEKLRELKDRLLDINEQTQTIQASADAEKRPLTTDEDRQIKNLISEFESVEEEINRREMIAAQTAKLTQSQGRLTDPQEPAPQNNADPEPTPAPRTSARQPRIQVISDRGKWGWNNMGDFAMAVRAASNKGATVIDPRLVANTLSTYSTEGTGSDGGFAVPPDFRTDIWKKVMAEDSLFGRTDQNPTSKNTIVLPADETTPWDATGGIQAYFESEASQMTQSKISLTEKTIRLNKLTALVPVTGELLEDAPGLDAYLRKKVAEKFDFKLNLKIIQGSGAGEPLGILKANSLISVAKESGQAADTLLIDNIDKMWSRLYAPLRNGAIWLINQDVEPQLYGLQRVVKNASGTIVGGTPAYMPPGGVSGSPYATLYGREIVPTQACETLGDKGDIILVNLKQYMTAYKQVGVKTDVSMHLWFDYDVLAYRFILRIAGQPWWANKITPRDGTNYPSWAVTLDERT